MKLLQISKYNTNHAITAFIITISLCIIGMALKQIDTKNVWREVP